MRWTSAMAGALALSLLAGAPAAAQNAAKNAVPISAEQQNAIRANCRPDFTAKCPGMASGGKDALACLQKNLANLAPACRKVVSATLPAVAAKPEAPVASPPPAAPAAEPPPAAPSPARPGQSTVRSAPPPRATLSSRSGVPHPAPPPQTPPPAPPGAAPAPTAAPTIKQAAAPTPPAPAATVPRAATAMPPAVSRACQRDLSLYCRGRGPGEAQKLACLNSRGTRLAPACKAALKAAGATR